MKFSRVLRLIAGFIEAIIRLIIFAAGIGLIVVTAYFLGFTYLQKILGNDAYNALNTIFWLAKWWPKIPFWYTGQGAGVSFIWGYPILPSLMVVVTSLWQKINLTAAFRIIGFLSVPLTAIGMSLFTWRRLKNQTVGIIAAIFYLLMPVTWIWLFEWGFYAESVASIFVFPVLLFYDRFLEGVVEPRTSQYRVSESFNLATRINLLLAVLFLVLTFASHPAVFFAVIRIIGIYSLIYAVLKRKHIKGLLIGLIPVCVVSLLTILAALFIIGNYVYYANYISANSGPSYVSKDDYILYSSIPFKSFLGLEKLLSGDIKFTVGNAVIPILVWLPAIVGSVLAIFISVKLFSLGLTAWLSFLFLFKLEIPYFLSTKLPLAGYLIGMRIDVLILKMILPILAAFGLWAIPGLILKLLTFWLKLKNELLKWLVDNIKGIIAGLVTLAIAGFLIFYLADYPSYIWPRDQVRYGPNFFSIRDPFRQSTKELLPLEQEKKADLWQQTGLKLLDINYWPKPDTTSDFFQSPYTRTSLFPYADLKEFNQQFGNDQFLRLDVSPQSGGVTQTLNAVNQGSMVNLYTITLNLISNYWGYQQQVAFQKNDGRVETATELAKWFGTRFLIFNKGADEMDKYKDNDNWQEWNPESTGMGVLEFKNSPMLWTLTEDRPTVLVIGDIKKKAFEPVFRAATRGALPYDDYWLVQGEEDLDNYNLKELEKFDILMLFGYHCKNQTSCLDTLKQYLLNGGRVYVSSGWQFVDQVWESKKLPEFFPVESIYWTDKFKNNDAYQQDSRLIGKIDMKSFGPLSWGDGGWGLAAATNLRPWAKTILAVNNQPIITAGEFGKGKIVLAGLNIIGHMHNFDYNQSEKDLFRKIFNWLKEPASQDLSNTVTAQRDFPDKIKFTFNQPSNKDTVFYFRESFFPAWQAALVSQNKSTPIKIYRGGPGFKLMKLPPLAAGETLVLEFKPGLRHWLLIIISGLAWLGLIAWVFLGKKMLQPVTKIFSNQINKIKGKVKTFKEGWKKDEEY